MRLTCPACGAATSLEAMTEDPAARRVAALFGQLPPQVARAVPAYLALFRPEKTGLRWTRTETVLELLVAMVADGFSRNGRRHRAPAEVWAGALHEVTSRPNLRRPLKNHGYLMEVVAGLADQHASTQERDREKQLRSGQRPADTPPPKSTTEVAIDAVKYQHEIGGITAEERDRRIRELHAGEGNDGE